MGKSSSSKKKDKKAKKNKAPKGKKARAKAKLHRQWGEEARDEGNPLRRGQEIKKKATSKKSQRYTHEDENDYEDETFESRKRTPQNDDSSSSSNSDDDDDSINDDNASSDNDDDDEDTKEAAVSSFLSTIQKKTKRKRQKLQQSHLDDSIIDAVDHHPEKEAVNTSNRNRTPQEGTSRSKTKTTSIEKDDETHRIRKSNNNNNDDPFLERFSHPPLPENDDELTAEMKRIHQMVKVPIPTSQSSSSLSSSDSMELQVSKVWMDEQQHPSTAHDWKDQTIRALCCHREILQQNWNKIQQQQHSVRSSSDENDDGLPFSVLYPLLASYADVLVPTVNSKVQSSSTQQALALHILNHVMTMRTRIYKHNRKLKQLETAVPEKAEAEEDDDGDQNNEQSSSSSSWSKDQGFTRPTVLVLLPTGGTCYTFVKILLSILSGTAVENDYANIASFASSRSRSTTLGAVDNLDRFEAEYGPVDPDDVDNNDEENEETANMTPEQKLRRKKILQQKGPEWLELFADDVNDNDDFKMGIAIQPKGTTGAKRKEKNSSTGGHQQQQHQQENSCTVKLYTDFYKSDIILASPLGLKMSLAAADNAGNDNDEGDDNDHDNHDDNTRHSRQQQNRGADFLSSIEICVLARADVMYMQNWDHVEDVLARVNQPLENSFHVDFARVRPYHLAGQAQHWRQLIVCSAWSDPLLSHTFTRHAQSIAGLARIRKRVSPERARIGQVLVVPSIKQVFQRISTTSVLTQGQDRIEYFFKHLLPRMIRHQQRHTLIFVPNYLEFVSLRNRLMQEQEATSGTTASTYCDFCAVTEYSRISETSRGRARFIQGRKPILLHTGRAHFFHRHLIKGARHLVFFGLPEYPEFYSHHVNLLNDASSTSGSKKRRGKDDSDDDDDDEATITLSCTVLFNKYESHALERIVGTSNCKRMVGGEKSTFFFVS